MWDGDGFLPDEGRRQLLGVGQLGGPDQEGQATLRCDERCGERERLFEALYGAQGDHTGLGCELFGAGGEYIDVCQCKGADDFAEEGRLFLIRLDQGDAEVRGPELDGNAGEAGAGAEIEKVNPVVGPWSLVVGKCGRGQLWYGALRRRTAGGGCLHANVARVKMTGSEE